METNVNHAEHAPPHTHERKQRFDGSIALLKDMAVPALIYLVITLVMFWPVTTSFATRIAASGGDAYQSMWNIWWTLHAVSSGHSIWKTNLLYWPVGANLITQDLEPISALISAPFSLVSLAAAYNFIFILGFVLSGLGMYLLAKYMTGSRYASVIAGIIFTFSAVHIAQAYGHINYTNLEWLPIFVLLLLKMLDTGKYRYAVLLGISFVLLMFMADIELGIQAILLSIAILAGYLAVKSKRHLVLKRRTLINMGIFAASAFIVGAWAYIPIIHFLGSGGTSTANSLNGIIHNELWSADLESFLLPSQYNGIFHSISNGYAQIYKGDPTETTTYVGYSVMALALIGLYGEKKRKTTIFWGIVALVFILLALGPKVIISGNPELMPNANVTTIPTLYQIYHAVPGINIIREPGRFDISAMLALSILAAFGIKHIEGRFSKWPKHKTMLLMAAVCAILLVELNGMPMSAALASQVTTPTGIPSGYTNMTSLIVGNYSVMVLPAIPNPYSLDPNIYQGVAMYYQTAFKEPIIDGYTSRENTTQQLSAYNIPLSQESLTVEFTGNITYRSPVLQNYTEQSLIEMYDYGVGAVAVEESAYNATSINAVTSYMSRVFGQPVYSGKNTMLYSPYSAEQRAAKNMSGFIAIPNLAEWSEYRQPITYGGQNITFWVPSYYGEMQLYVPQSSAPNINATINVNAFAVQSGAVLDIYKAQGASSPSIIGTITPTAAPENYTINATFQSGQQSTLLFVPTTSQGQSNVSSVAVTGITIKRK